MDTLTRLVKGAGNGGFDIAATGNGVPTATPTPAIDFTISPAPPVTLPTRYGVDLHSTVHAKLTKVQRAVLAAEILDGRIGFLNPPARLVADGLGVSISYIAAARRLSPAARREAARGYRPLVSKRG